MFLTDPNVNCPHCFKLYRESDGNFKPACYTPSGCPIGEDLATDEEVNELLGEFAQAKALYEFNGISTLAEQTYKDLGLLEDLRLLFELEAIWKEASIQRAQRSERRSSSGRWNKIV